VSIENPSQVLVIVGPEVKGKDGFPETFFARDTDRAYTTGTSLIVSFPLRIEKDAVAVVGFTAKLRELFGRVRCCDTKVKEQAQKVVIDMFKIEDIVRVESVELPRDISAVWYLKVSAETIEAIVRFMAQMGLLVLYGDSVSAILSYEGERPPLSDCSDSEPNPTYMKESELALLRRVLLEKTAVPA